MSLAAASLLRRIGLFHQVALHGGIAGAVRHMPDPIQQPALSEQMHLLEQELRTTLFRRQPFQLTAAGAALFKVLKGPLQELEILLPRLAGFDRRISIGVAGGALEPAIPALLSAILAASADLLVTFRTGPAEMMPEWLRDGRADLVLTTHEGRLPPGIRARKLASLPLVLAVPDASPLNTAADLWESAAPPCPFISPDPEEGLGRSVHRELSRGGICWPVALRTSSTSLMLQLVQRGFGIGITPHLAALPRPAGIRLLPLAGFSPLPICVCWRGGDRRRIGTWLGPLEDFFHRFAPDAP